jgi:hypothetical protein
VGVRLIEGGAGEGRGGDVLGGEILYRWQGVGLEPVGFRLSVKLEELLEGVDLLQYEDGVVVEIGGDVLDFPDQISERGKVPPHPLIVDGDGTSVGVLRHVFGDRPGLLRESHKDDGGASLPAER